MSDDHIYDPVRATAPFTRIDAYFLLSKMKRLLTANTSLLLALHTKDDEKLENAKAAYARLSDEVNALIDGLVYNPEEK